MKIRKVKEVAKSMEKVELGLCSFDLIDSEYTSHSFFHSLTSLETNRWNLSFPSSNAFHVPAQHQDTGFAKHQ